MHWITSGVGFLELTSTVLTISARSLLDITILFPQVFRYVGCSNPHFAIQVNIPVMLVNYLL